MISTVPNVDLSEDSTGCHILIDDEQIIIAGLHLDPFDSQTAAE